MKTATLFITTIAACSLRVLSQPPDNGVPAKEVKEWREVWNPTTGSAWRTKTNVKTGETLSYNPFTSEIWRNRTTGQAEAVLREDWVEDGIKAAKEKMAKLITVSPDSSSQPRSTSQYATEALAPPKLRIPPAKSNGSSQQTRVSASEPKSDFTAWVGTYGEPWIKLQVTADGRIIDISHQRGNGMGLKVTLETPTRTKVISNTVGDEYWELTSKGIAQYFWYRNESRWVVGGPYPKLSN